MFSLAKNDFKTKYAGSYLGIVWAFIQPIVTILVYWFVFSVGLKAGTVSDYPFVLYLVSGIVPWFFFQDALNGGTNALIEYNYLVKKVVFKISILPIVKNISALFVLVFFAALTSSVSVMEAIVSMLIDRFHISRIKACLGVIIFSVALGIPCSLGNGVWSHITILGMDVLTFFDFISNCLLLPIVAFFTCLMIGWSTGADYIIGEATKNGETFKRENLCRVMNIYIATV